MDRMSESSSGTTRMFRSDAQAQFLRVEASLALCFVSIASQSQDPIRIDRLTKSGRKAYDTLVHFMERVYLTPRERAHLMTSLSRLRLELRNLGEQV